MARAFSRLPRLLSPASGRRRRLTGMDVACGHPARMPSTGRGVGRRDCAIGHYRVFSRPSTGTVGIWLDDLVASPGARGGGAGRAVLHRLAEIAGAQGCTVVRWITAEDNHQAQERYDKVATRTHWVTYDAVPLS